jgi:hypothetical protein
VQDWYKPCAHPSVAKDERTLQGVQATETGSQELIKTIKAIHRALKPGGRVFWRSAALEPWYAALFAQEGFEVEAISVGRGRSS